MRIKKDILESFKIVGQDLFSHGLVSSYSGNTSVRDKGFIIITRRGSRLGSLTDADFVKTSIDKVDEASKLASVEHPVHRSIYQKTGAKAIVHAHLPHAIALSMSESEIIPEGGDTLADIGRVPIIGKDKDTRPGRLADEISETLKDHKIVMVCGHGSFAIGDTLEEAYSYTTALEECCQVTWLVKTLRKRSI